MHRSASNRNRAFTLVELLVVVLILSILMAVALPLYLSTVNDAQKKTCRANQQTIANSVWAGRIKLGANDFSLWNGGTVTALITASPDKLPDLVDAPTCPSGGIYSIAIGSTGDNSTFKVVCNVGVHGTFQPGVDSN